MASRSVNKVFLIGNITKDPELKYTNNGSAVCTFTIATNRNWVTERGEKKEESEFHRCTAWNKLAELVPQLAQKGTKMYIEGRLTNRKFQKEGLDMISTEIIVEELIILDKGTNLNEIYKEDAMDHKEPMLI